MARSYQPNVCSQRGGHAFVLAGVNAFDGVLCIFGDLTGGRTRKHKSVYSGKDYRDVYHRFLVDREFFSLLGLSETFDSPRYYPGRIYAIGLLTRIGRSSMLEVLRQDYVMTARAKGLSQYLVIYKHALKNAFIPVITMLGISFGYLLGGSVLIESTFSWPGMGRYAVRAITFLDFPAVMGVTVVIAFLFVLINLFVDFLYYFIDPRIRYD